MEKIKLLIGAMVFLLAIGFSHAITEGVLVNDVVLSTAKITALNNTGISKPTVSACIDVDGFVCRAKVYEENGINKEVEVTYKTCNKWDDSECSGWVSLSQTEIESQVQTQVNNLINEIANVEISRSQRAETRLTREIELTVREGA